MYPRLSVAALGASLALTCALVPSALAVTSPYLAGYEPMTDVTEHSEIDLDLKHIIEGLGETCGSACALSDCRAPSDKTTGFGCGYDGADMAFPQNDGDAYHIWKNGQNSSKTSGMRTLMGFASGAAAKCSKVNGVCEGVRYEDNVFISKMNAYWKTKGLNEHTWGAEMIDAAFRGTVPGSNPDLDFSEVGRTFRKEAIQKGIVYLNVFPYVIWEMQDAVNDCEQYAGSTNNDDKSVHAWDEAVAFYAGSEVGAGYGTSATGRMQYALADKRCANFGTCAGAGPHHGVAEANAEILKLFNSGKEWAAEDAVHNCGALDDLHEKIATKMLVPLVQGALRYLYKTRTVTGRSAKQVGELWAFASAILPFVHDVDPNAAEMLYRRAWKLDFERDSYEAIKAALEATYAGLGAGAGVGTITCADIGDLYDDPDTVLSAGTCYASGGKRDDEELALGLGLGLGLLAAALLVVAVVFGVRERRTRLMYEDIVSANKMGHPADMDIKHPPV